MFFTQNPIGSSATEDLQDNAISFDYAMNSPAALWQDRFGKQHKTVQQALKDVGFKPAGFDFVNGGTLGIGDRDKCVFYPTDGYWYSWNGKLPYVVPANSSPTPGGKKGWGIVTRDERVIAREALRRTYQEAGYDLVEGSFEQGGVLVNSNDVLLQERTGKVFSGPAGVVAAGTDPASGGFVDRSGELLRSRLIFNVLDFGAAGDGTTNDSPAFVSAILYVALAGGGRIIAPYRSYKLTETVIVPSCVELDFCNSEIIGPGLGSSVDVFQSGYLSGGAVISNIGAPPETILVRQAAVKNASIRDCGKVFNLYNFLFNSELSNIYFTNCTQPVYAARCFYGRFVNLFSRGSGGGTTLPAFYFRDFVNVCAIESVFVSGRVTGIEISSGANGQTLYCCSAEGCTNGIIISGETGPIKLDTCYLEGDSGIGVDLSAGGFKYDVTFDNCFFNKCGTAINRGTNGSRIHVYENNRFLACPNVISGLDNYNDLGEVEIAPVPIANNGYPSIPAGYALGGKSRVRHENILFDSATGFGMIKTQVHGNTLVPFNYEGKAGGPKAGTVAFCEHSKTAGTTFSIIIDTKIAFNKHAALLAYRITIADELSAYELFGNIYGDKAKSHDGFDKTVAVSNNGGFIRLTFDSFYSSVQTYSCTGVVRHV
ncbi:putative pectin lyase [Aeromonas phage PS2]|nr:putative pectin lyase [Aeromonas phage PS2]